MSSTRTTPRASWRRACSRRGRGTRVRSSRSATTRVDKKQAQNLDRDDMVTTVMSAFTSDDGPLRPLPRPQVRPDRAGGVLRPPGRLRRRRPGQPAVRPRPGRRTADAPRRSPPRRTRRLAGTADRRAATRRPSREWERRRTDAVWEVVDARRRSTTANGSVPTKLADGSVRFGGPRPERDTYTLTLTPGRTTITGAPARSPDGRRAAAQGAGPAGQRQPAPQRGPRLRRRRRARQRGRADPRRGRRLRPGRLDGRPWPSTASRARPGASTPPSASRTRRSSRSPGRWRCPPAVTLRVVLEQTHGGGHLIGRLRLAVTDAERPEGRSAAARRDRRDLCDARRASAARRSGRRWPGTSCSISSRPKRRRCPRRARSSRRRATSRPRAVSARRRGAGPCSCCAAARSASRCGRRRPARCRACRACPGQFALSSAGRRGRAPGGAGALAGRPAQRADLAVARQPPVAPPLRPRHRRHAGRHRQDGRAAVAPGTARLARLRGPRRRRR